MVICLERNADVHMAQLMPLTVSCFSKIQTGFTFLVVPEKGPLNGCVCVYFIINISFNLLVKVFFIISVHLAKL